MMGTAWWKWQLKFVNAFAVAAGVLIIVAILLVLVDVCTRSIGFKPPGFTVAAVEYILLYFVLLSAPYLVRNKGHVLTDMVFQRLPKKIRWWIEKLIYTLCIVISVIFMTVGGFLFYEALLLGYLDERSIDIPYWLLYFLFPPCFLLIALEFLRYLLGVDSLYEGELQLDSV
jgi:C4-dicarboxylate transporter, DctQ subunit